jgi:hypothetical protein
MNIFPMLNKTYLCYEIVYQMTFSSLFLSVSDLTFHVLDVNEAIAGFPHLQPRYI